MPFVRNARVFLLLLALMLPACAQAQRGKIANQGPATPAPAAATPAPTALADKIVSPVEPTPPPSTPKPADKPPQPMSVSEVIYNQNLGLKGYLCRPEGSGPFAAVVYNHGGLGTTIGGAPEETCLALAAAGMVGFSPIRRETIPLQGHVEDVAAAVDFVKGLSYAAPGRLGIIGFSRGGLLTLLTASARTDFQAVVVMASAAAKESELSQITAGLQAPTLLMVSSNDLPADLNKGQNLVVEMQNLEQALLAAGADVRLIMYPPFDPHGHLMFFEIGDYWEEVLSFLNAHL